MCPKSFWYVTMFHPRETNPKIHFQPVLCSTQERPSQKVCSTQERPSQKYYQPVLCSTQERPSPKILPAIFCCCFVLLSFLYPGISARAGNKFTGTNSSSWLDEITSFYLLRLSSHHATIGNSKLREASKKRKKGVHVKICQNSRTSQNPEKLGFILKKPETQTPKASKI